MFPLFSSLTGLPLENILEVLRKHNMIVDWIDFYEQSVKEGWKSNRTINKIKESVSEIYGTEFGIETEKRLNLYLIDQK